MGFDIFLQARTEGDATGFDRKIVEQAFAPYVADLSGDHWNIHWPDGGACFAEVYIDDEEIIHGFMVSRPPGFMEFWNAMFDILLQTKSLLLWPEEYPNFCIADPEALAGLPPDFVANEGPIPVVSSGAEIWEMIK